jgi:hypothetical protein
MPQKNSYAKVVKSGAQGYVRPVAERSHMNRTTRRRARGRVDAKRSRPAKIVHHSPSGPAWIPFQIVFQFVSSGWNELCVDTITNVFNDQFGTKHTDMRLNDVVVKSSLRQITLILVDWMTGKVQTTAHLDNTSRVPGLRASYAKHLQKQSFVTGVACPIRIGSKDGATINVRLRGWVRPPVAKSSTVTLKSCAPQEKSPPVESFRVKADSAKPKVKRSPEEQMLLRKQRHEGKVPPPHRRDAHANRFIVGKTCEGPITEAAYRRNERKLKIAESRQSPAVVNLRLPGDKTDGLPDLKMSEWQMKMESFMLSLHNQVGELVNQVATLSLSPPSSEKTSSVSRTATSTTVSSPSDWSSVSDIDWSLPCPNVRPTGVKVAIYKAWKAGQNVAPSTPASLPQRQRPTRPHWVRRGLCSKCHYDRGLERCAIDCVGCDE